MLNRFDFKDIDKIFSISTFDGILSTSIILNLNEDVLIYYDNHNYNNRRKITRDSVMIGLPNLNNVLEFRYGFLKSFENSDKRVFSAYAPTISQVVLENVECNKKNVIENVTTLNNSRDFLKYENWCKRDDFSRLEESIDAFNFNSNYEFMNRFTYMQNLARSLAKHSYQDVMMMGSVRNQLIKSDEKYEKDILLIEKYNKYHGLGIFSVDLFSEDKINRINKYLVLKEIPESRVSIISDWCKLKDNNYALLMSLRADPMFFYDHSKTHLGKIMKQYGGGGSALSAAVRLSGESKSFLMNQYYTLKEKIIEDIKIQMQKF